MSNTKKSSKINSLSQYKKTKSRSKKNKKTNHKKRIIIAVLIVTIAIASFVLITLFSKVTIVKSEGSSLYTSERTEKIIFANEGTRSPFLIFFKNLFGGYNDIPFVESYSVEVTGLHSVRVKYKIKEMIGCISYKKQYIYLNREGKVVEKSIEKYPAIPLVTGIKSEDYKIGDMMPSKSKNVIKPLSNIKKYLSQTAIKWKDKNCFADEVIERVDFDKKENIMLYVGDIGVYLGANINLEDKIHEMADILPSLYGKKGTLHLETYELSGTNHTYSFK